MHPYRIFLSYAHADKEKIDHIAARLEEMRLAPVWDRHGSSVDA